MLYYIIKHIMMKYNLNNVFIIDSLTNIHQY